jgi:hypothetical protein
MISNYRQSAVIDYYYDNNDGDGLVMMVCVLSLLSFACYDDIVACYHYNYNNNNNNNNDDNDNDETTPITMTMMMAMTMNTGDITDITDITDNTDNSADNTMLSVSTKFFVVKL